MYAGLVESTVDALFLEQPAKMAFQRCFTTQKPRTNMRHSMGEGDDNDTHLVVALLRIIWNRVTPTDDHHHFRRPPSKSAKNLLR